MPPLTFRPIVSGDLPRLHRWLNDPEVVRWWEGDDVSWPAVRLDYGTTAGDPEDHYIAVHAGRPIGWIQCYAIADQPGDPLFYAPLGPADNVASIDYLLAPQARGQGLGQQMIRNFVDEVVFGQHPDWTQVWVAPQRANEASWRALAAAGFRYARDLPGEHCPCRAMMLTRPAPSASSE